MKANHVCYLSIHSIPVIAMSRSPYVCLFVYLSLCVSIMSLFISEFVHMCFSAEVHTSKCVCLCFQGTGYDEEASLLGAGREVALMKTASGKVKNVRIVQTEMHETAA